MDFAEFLDQYGLPIAMLIALAVGRFVPGFVYSERKKEVEDGNAEIKRLNDKIIEQVAPALARQADVVEMAFKLMTEMREERTLAAQVKAELDRRDHSPGTGTE